MEDEINDFDSRAESIMLNCGATPKLSDLELNVISDDVNYICDELLFVHLLKDKNRAYRLILDNDIKFIKDFRNDGTVPARLTKMQKERFKDIDIPNSDLSNPETAINKVTEKMNKFLFPDDPKPKIWNNVTEFEEALDRLGENLEGINGKKESLGVSVRYVMQPSVYLYIAYIVVNFYYYAQTLLDVENGGAVQAERYNIGFISQSTYAALIYRFTQHYEKYLKITYTDGDLDSGVCSSVSDIITHIRVFYRKLMCLKGNETDDNKANCTKEMLDAMYEIYEDKYVNNVFMAAKSEFKAAVNSINKFIEKKNKFLLREENFDANYTADNEAFEHVYRVFLHNAGANLFKDDRNANKRRSDVRLKSYQYDNNKNILRYDDFLKHKLLESFINILSDPAVKEPPANGLETNSKHLRCIVEILFEIEKEYLPEYFELVDLIFNIDTKQYFNYSNTKFVEESYINISNLTYSNKHFEYFSEVRDKLKLSGAISFQGDMIDSELTKTTLLTRIQSRKKNVLTIQKLYEEFQSKIRTSAMTEADIREDGKFYDIYTKIKEDFNTVTEEYKITKTIVMTHLKNYIESDEEFQNNPTLRDTAILNINFIVESMVNQLKISRDVRNTVLNNVDINLNKYISFMKFENKLTQLDENDLERLFHYVKQINMTMRNFRKYTKSEEMSFSKRFQKAEIYETAVNDTKWCAFVLIFVHFYDMLELEDKFENLDYLAKSSVAQDLRNAKTKAASTLGLERGLVKGAERLGSKTASAMKSTKSGLSNTASSAFQSARSKMSSSSAPGTTFVTAQQGVMGKLGKMFGKKQKAGDGQSFDDTAQENKEATKSEKSEKKKESDDESDDESEESGDKKKKKKKDLQEQFVDLIVPFVASIAAWNILFTFMSSYLTKYKTDINYDKVTNITNTEIFERELEKYEGTFRDYIEKNRDTKACKEMYLQLMNTLEAYEHCNFVKGSFKSTPFPATDMLTNGLLLAVCFGIFYVAYTGTGMKDRQKNTKNLKEILMEEISEMQEDLTEDSVKKSIEIARGNLEKEWYKLYKSWAKTYMNGKDNPKTKEELKKYESREIRFRTMLIKFLDKFDNKLERLEENKLVKQLREEDKYPISTLESIEQYLKKGSPKALVDSTKDLDKRGDIYFKIMGNYDDGFHDKLEGQGETWGAGNSFKGGNRRQFGQNVAAPEASGIGNQGAFQPVINSQGFPVERVERVDLTVQNEMLKQYTRKKDKLEAQLLLMQRDNKGLVNWALAGAILSFSFYFVDILDRNTNRYKKLMSSGGTYSRECLY